MTTVQDTPSIGKVLSEYRKDKGLSKAAMYRALGVSAGTYDTWEGGVYVPGDDYAEVLADILDIELREVVWMLYKDRLRPDFVHSLNFNGVPLSGRQTVDYRLNPTLRGRRTTDWDGRPIEIYSDSERLRAA